MVIIHLFLHDFIFHIIWKKDSFPADTLAVVPTCGEALTTQVTQKSLQTLANSQTELYKQLSKKSGRISLTF